MPTNYEIRRHQNSLQFASRLLLFALLAQLPLLAVAVLRIFFLDLTVPEKLFWFFSALSSLFAIVGFIMVRRQLDLWNEAVENSHFSGVMRPRTVRGMEMAGGIQLLFYGMLLIPLFNLPGILWGRAKANAALRDIDALHRVPRKPHDLQHRRSDKPKAPSDA